MVQSIDDARRRTTRATGSRVPPHNLQAEESLLGAMLLSRDAIAAALEVCSPDDFYKPAYGHVFDAIATLYGQGEPADPVTVADELRRAGLLDAIGGPAILTDLVAATPFTGNAAHYAHIVEEFALLRKLIGVGAEISELGYSVPDDVVAAIDSAEAMVFDIAQRRVTDTIADLKGLLGNTLDRLAALYERGEAITGTPTGYLDLDERLSGLQPSALTIVGARPGCGKTSFALGMAAHAAVEKRLPVLFFSLEMSHDEVTQRLLSAEASVEATKLRNGKLNDNDWKKISHAIGRLSEAPLWIDDNPNLTVMEMRAKARRLKSRLGGLSLIVVDYLQLMSGRRSAENRQVEVSEMSRSLKILARELEVPVVALSQLSRGLEMRADKRPMLADLRESGCMPASTRLLRADNGQEVTLGELVLSQEQPMVLSLDDDWKLVPRRLVKTFPSGIKPVFRLTLASGREVEATANHPFRTIDGWTRLDQLEPGQHLAVPRRLPAPTRPSEMRDDELVLLAHLLGDGSIGPNGVKYATADDANKKAVEDAARSLLGIEVTGKKQGRTWLLWLPSPYRLTHNRHHPVRNWLEPLGLWGSRSHDRFVPEPVFGLDDAQIALFLRHLWATDGSITVGKNARGPMVTAYYATTSRRLADNVRRLLLRLDIRCRISRARKTGYRDSWHVHVTGTVDLQRFLTVVGCHGERGACTEEALAILAPMVPNPNVDLVPWSVASNVKEALQRAGITHRQLAERLGERYAGAYLLGSESRPRRFSRRRLERIAEIVGDTELHALATSDVFWDEIVEIVPLGPMPVFDATIEDTHNFIADGIIAHNSLEQDADVVMFLYRDELYNSESPDRGTAEVIVAKHRSGPTGTERLAFLDRFTRFANMARV